MPHLQEYPCDAPFRSFASEGLLPAQMALPKGLLSGGVFCFLLRGHLFHPMLGIEENDAVSAAFFGEVEGISMRL